MTTFSGILGGWCGKQTLFDWLCAVLEQSLLTSCLPCHKCWSWHVDLVLWCVCWGKNWKVGCFLCSYSLFLFLEVTLLWAEPFKSSSGEICCNQFCFSICLSVLQKIFVRLIYFSPPFSIVTQTGGDRWAAGGVLELFCCPPSEGQAELVFQHVEAGMSYMKDHLWFKPLTAFKENKAFGCVAFRGICETNCVV